MPPPPPSPPPWFFTWKMIKTPLPVLNLVILMFHLQITLFQQPSLEVKTCHLTMKLMANMSTPGPKLGICSETLSLVKVLFNSSGLKTNTNIIWFGFKLTHHFQLILRFKLTQKLGSEMLLPCFLIESSQQHNTSDTTENGKALIHSPGK